MDAGARWWRRSGARPASPPMLVLLSIQNTIQAASPVAAAAPVVEAVKEAAGTVVEAATAAL